MKKIALFSFMALSMNMYASPEIDETVKKLKMEELAKTYSKEKAEHSLKGYGALKKERLDDLSKKALLVDIGALNVEELNSGKNVKNILKNYTEDYLDMSENSLGNISDKGIIERVNKKWSQSEVIRDTVLLDRLNEALAKGLMTGYNIKDKKDSANFNRKMSLSYGHNNIIHADQLIALLKSENVDAKIQLEPKTSAYLHMPEWGEPGKPNMVLKDGKIVITPLEYDLKFEFATQGDKEKFVKIINRYAKKDAKDQTGLIYKAWWQPFMQTTKMDNFHILTVNMVSDGKYQAYVLTLPEKSKAFLDEIKKDKSLEVKTEEVYVNPSFYRFMLGEYK